MKKTKNSLSKQNQKKLFKDVKVYCANSGINQGKLCELMDYSQTQFSLVVNGHQNPGLVFWHNLEKATDGQIKRGDYYDD